MPVSLSYMSEELFSEMVNRLREAFLALCKLSDRADVSYVRSSPRLAYHEVALRPFCERSFDGASRIDVLVRLRRDLATAFELKLGTTRLTRTRIDEWLSGCTPSHDDRRWKGNMMSILERKFPVGHQHRELAVELDNEFVTITREWFVVARRRVITAWERSPPAFSGNVRFLVFEDLVNHFGGRDPFNALIRSLMAFDYYERWVLGSDEPDEAG